LTYLNSGWSLAARWHVDRSDELLIPSARTCCRPSPAAVLRVSSRILRRLVTIVNRA